MILLLPRLGQPTTCGVSSSGPKPSGRQDPHRRCKEAKTSNLTVRWLTCCGSDLHHRQDLGSSPSLALTLGVHSCRVAPRLSQKRAVSPHSFSRSFRSSRKIVSDPTLLREPNRFGITNGPSLLISENALFPDFLFVFHSRCRMIRIFSSAFLEMSVPHHAYARLLANGLIFAHLSLPFFFLSLALRVIRRHRSLFLFIQRIQSFHLITVELKRKDIGVGSDSRRCVGFGKWGEA